MTLITRDFWTSLHDAHPAAEQVWGCAYRISAGHVDEVKEYLDIREINGYSIHYTAFHAAPSEGDGRAEQTIRCMVYIGTPENAQFTGVQEPQALAEHIWQSRGPSGLNRDYLLGLEGALKELGPGSGDVHVEDLARRVRAIERRERGEGEVAEGGRRAERERNRPAGRDLEEELEEVEG